MNSHNMDEMSDTEKITVGIDIFPSIFRMKNKVLGDNNENVEYILNETGAVMTLRGKGSGFLDFKEKKESDEPLHIHVRYKNMDAREKTRELIINLIDTVQQDFINSTYGKYYSPPKKPEIIPVPINKIRRTSSYNSLPSRSPVRSMERTIDRTIDRRSMEKRSVDNRISLEPRPYEKRSSLEPRPYEKRSSLEPRPYENRAPEPRPYENRHPESRPFESRSSEPRPYDSRPIEPRPFESRAPEPRPYDDRAPESRPFDSRPSESNPFENRSSEARPHEKRTRESRFESRPVEPRIESRPVEPRFESRPVESRFESRPVEPRFESRPVEPRFESRPVETRFESRPVEPRFESRPVEPRPFENRPTDRKSVEKPLPDSTKPSPGENITSNIEKITIGIESVPPAFNLKSKIYGPNLANVKHIEKVANALLLVEGKGCGVNSSGEESQEPPYILVKYLKPELKEVARGLIFNLIETIQQEYIQLYGRYPGGPQKPQIVPIKKLLNDKTPPDSIKMKTMPSDITPVPPPPPVISKISSPDRFDNVPPPANFGITIPKPLSPKLFANAEPTPVPRPVQPVIPSTTNTFDPLVFQRLSEPNPLPVASPLSGIGSQSSILNSVLSSQPRLRQPGSFVTSETSQAQIQTIQTGKTQVEILDDSLEILANGQQPVSLIESCKPRSRKRGANSRKNYRNRKKQLQKNHSEKRSQSPVESAATEAKRFCSTGVGTFNPTIPSSVPAPPKSQRPPGMKVPKGNNPFQRNLIPVTVNQQPTPAPVATNSMKAPPVKPALVPKPTPPTSANKSLPGILKKPQWNDIRNGSNREKSDSEDEGLVSNPIILSDSEDEELNQRRNTLRISATVTKNGGRDISVQTDDKLYQTQIKNIKCACGRFMHVVTGVRSVETQTIGGDSFRRF